MIVQTLQNFIWDVPENIHYQTVVGVLFCFHQYNLLIKMFEWSHIHFFCQRSGKIFEVSLKTMYSEISSERCCSEACRTSLSWWIWSAHRWVKRSWIEELGADVGKNEKMFRKLHHVLLEVHLVDGYLRCPESSRRIPVKQGWHPQYAIAWRWSLVAKYKSSNSREHRCNTRSSFISCYI